MIRTIRPSEFFFMESYLSAIFLFDCYPRQSLFFLACSDLCSANRRKPSLRMAICCFFFFCASDLFISVRQQTFSEASPLLGTLSPALAVPLSQSDVFNSTFSFQRSNPALLVRLTPDPLRYSQSGSRLQSEAGFPALLLSVQRSLSRFCCALLRY